MLKPKVRNLVRDRAPLTYQKSIVTVLLEIINLTFVPDWRKNDIEVCYSRAATFSKLAFNTNLDWHTVAKAIKALTSDGVIKAHSEVADSYAVVPTALQLLKSKFRNTGTKKLEQRILNMVRMRLARRDDNILCSKALGTEDKTRENFENGMLNSNPERYAAQKALGRFDWDTTTEKNAEFALEHPAPNEHGGITCGCVPPFCSHPSTI